MKWMKFLLLMAIVSSLSPILSQENQDLPMTNQAIVEKFLSGFNHPEKISESLNLLADDYHFQNPLLKLNSKAEFIALAQQIGAVLTGVKLLHIAENGDWVGCMYEFKSSIPELESNIASEWFRIEDGKIQESRLIYDATKWHKVYEEMEK